MASSHTNRIAAVILAAGMSRRMGRAKPLLDFGGRPLIGRIVEALQSVNWEGEAPAEPAAVPKREAARRERRPPGNRIHPIAIVTGHEPQAIVAAIEQRESVTPFPSILGGGRGEGLSDAAFSKPLSPALPRSTGGGSQSARSSVQFVHNPLYETGGMISSVQAGVRAVAQQCDAFLLALADHASPRPDTLRSLIDDWQKSHSAIVLPTHQGKHGHPILISSSLANQILALTFNDTLATIVKLNSRDSRDVAVDDPAILEDIDTPEDYNRALKRWREENEPRMNTDEHG
jgi:CTP:molybdopterin cytidylyltransferase MocA